MWVSVISLIFSFLFQGYISTMLDFSLINPSWFSTIYILVNLIVLLPYYEDTKKYLRLLIVFGILMDIVYTNTIILNALIFLIIYFICKKINQVLPHNIFTINLLNVLGVILFHILTFLILFLIQYDSYSIISLIRIITHSILMTIIYGSLLYIIIDGILKKFNVKTIK